MRLPAPVKPQPVRSEQIILFRISGQLFAVSSASVQEVRSVDTLDTTPSSGIRGDRAEQLVLIPQRGQMRERVAAISDHDREIIMTVMVYDVPRSAE